MTPLKTIHEEPHLEEKAQFHILSHPPLIPSRLWWDILFLSLILLVVTSLYYFATEGVFTLRSFNRVCADISIILIGFSMGLSGLCYFWNFADKFIVYRKELGVIGFGYALVHTGITVMRTPLQTLIDRDPLSFWAAIGAIVVYTIMVLITNTVLFRILGGRRWRILMRWGYVGFILSIVHFALKDASSWIMWLTGASSLFPPFSLLMFLLGTGFIILRIALFIDILRHRVASTPSTPQLPQQK